MPARVLVLEDEQSVRENIAEALRLEGYEVHAAETAGEARTALGDNEFDCLLVDRKLPDEDGVDFLVDLRRSGTETPVIVITGHPSLDTAVEALRNYAFDYLPKPFHSQQIVDKVGAALKADLAFGDNYYFRERLRESFQFDCVLSRNRRAQEAHIVAMKVADSDATMLIEGESGTGKEYLARAVHLASARRSNRMICLNCAALPEPLLESELFGHEKGAFTNAISRKKGLVEVAHEGTLLLDEVGDIPTAIQAKLLRFLQDKSFQRLGAVEVTHVDARVIAATNQRLLDAVRSGKFREDLYYRLSVVPIWLPPLRERPEDIPVFVRHFLAKHGRAHRGRDVDIADDALEMLVQHTWPGNIRELENCIQRAVLLAPTTTLRRQDVSLTDGLRRLPITSDLSLAGAEKQHIEAVLRRAGENRTRAAKLLNIDPKTLRRKLRSHGMDEQPTLL
jgi:DNA-binding NtrC family response regulator